jgi:hypothetical protein
MSNLNTNSIDRVVTRTFYDDGTLQSETLTNGYTVLKYHFNTKGRLVNKEIYSLEKTVNNYNEIKCEQKLVYSTNAINA